MINFRIVPQGRVLLEELILSIILSGKAIVHTTLHGGYITQHSPKGEYWLFFVLGNTLDQKGNIERLLKV